MRVLYMFVLCESERLPLRAHRSVTGLDSRCVMVVFRRHHFNDILQDTLLVNVQGPDNGSEAVPIFRRRAMASRTYIVIGMAGLKASCIVATLNDRDICARHHHGKYGREMEIRSPGRARRT